MRLFLRLSRYFLILCVLGVVLGIGSIALAYWLLSPRMPPVGTLQSVELQVPLRVLSADGQLIATFGTKHRIPVQADQVPEHLKQAVLSAEDADFYSHPGFDWRAILRAAWHVVISGGQKVQGGSTITQQVARSFFLSPEKLYTRKMLEIFIAVRMEQHLSKDEILALYLNKMFMGHRSYGVAAAADYYYGESLDQLSLAQCAMLAGLFQLPSVVNPVTSPERAVARRNWVLGQMRSNGFITEAEYQQAVSAPDHAFPHDPPVAVDAPYIAEMARQAAVDLLGKDAMTGGYVVTTTINARDQRAARHAVRKGLIRYDHRHGYRGPLEHVQLKPADGPARYGKILQPYNNVAGMLAALVTGVSNDSATLYIKGGDTAIIGFDAVAWARPRLSVNAMGPRPDQVSDVLTTGDVVRLRRNGEGDWELTEFPSAQAALISMNPDNGAIKALVGGFSFVLSQYNRAVDITRQPGSAFKPFLYSAALDHGFTAASIVNDAPLAVPDPSQADGTWTPTNAEGSFAGPMRVRMGLAESKNMVSIRLLDAIGIGYARHYITRFGLPLDSMPKALSLALGTASVSPLMMARGYAVIANGGYLVKPWYIKSITDRDGKLLFESHPVHVCHDCGASEPVASLAQVAANDRNQGAIMLPVRTTAAEPDNPDNPATDGRALHVLDSGNAFIMQSMMRSVIRVGTGHAAMRLGRSDLSGKTGTTDNHRDTWFSGFNDNLVATVWVGHDDYTTLGRHAYGSSVALPIWITYMGAALEGSEAAIQPRPDSVVTAMIDRDTGLLAAPDDPDAMREYFRKDALKRLAARSPEPGEEKHKDSAYTIF